VNGIYPWEIKLNLNPKSLEKKIAKIYPEKSDEEVRRNAAYICFLVEQHLFILCDCMYEKYMEKKEGGKKRNDVIDVAFAKECMREYGIEKANGKRGRK